MLLISSTMNSKLNLNIVSQAEKEKTNVELDDELDDDLNNFGNVFEVLQPSDHIWWNLVHPVVWQEKQEFAGRGGLQGEERQEQDLRPHPEGDRDQGAQQAQDQRKWHGDI